MKKFILYLFITTVIIEITPDPCKAQNKKTNYAVFSADLGYTTNIKDMTGGLHLGYRFKNVFVSSGMIIRIGQNAVAPLIFPFNLGYNIGSFQPFISYSYESIGREAETRFKGTPNEFRNGFRPGAGLSYYFKTMPISLTAQRLGKQNNISIGIYQSF